MKSLKKMKLNLKEKIIILVTRLDTYMHCATNMACIDVQNRQNFVENRPFSMKSAANRQNFTVK